MKTDAKTQIRIEGYAETDPIIGKIVKIAQKHGIGIATAARILLKEALDARDQPPGKELQQTRTALNDFRDLTVEQSKKIRELRTQLAEEA